MKGLIHKVRCDLYKTELRICFCKDTFSKRHDHHGNYGGCVIPEGQVIHIYLEKYGTEIHVADTAHEAFHAADFICDSAGMVNFEGSGNEHIAYLVGWIVSKIFDCLVLDNEAEEKLNKKSPGQGL